MAIRDFGGGMSETQPLRNKPVVDIKSQVEMDSSVYVDKEYIENKLMSSILREMEMRNLIKIIKKPHYNSLRGYVYEARIKVVNNDWTNVVIEDPKDDSNFGFEFGGEDYMFSQKEVIEVLKVTYPHKFI